MGTIQGDTESGICSTGAKEVSMGDRQLQQRQKDSFVIPTSAIGGVLVVGDDGDISGVDIEHHKIMRLEASAVISDSRNHSPLIKPQETVQRADTVDGTISIVHQKCDDCVVFRDSGCVVTCPNHHNLNLPYAASVSSSPESTDTPGSRSSSPTFSNSGLSISYRCSETPSIASSLALGGGDKERDKGKGKEREIVPVTVPEAVHLPRTSLSDESRRRSGDSDLGATRVMGRKRVFPHLPPQRGQDDLDDISVIPAPMTVHAVDAHSGERVRERPGEKVVSFAFPEGDVYKGTAVSADAELGRLEDGYREDLYYRWGYKWLMLVYLTIFNPIICFTNALLTIFFLALLTLTYPFKKLTTKSRRSNPPVQLTTSGTLTTPTNAPPQLSYTSYLSTHIRTHLSSPLFLHLRIIYQTSRPPPSPDEWDARRLVIVHLSAPAMSLIPCGLAAWGAMLMWVYSVLLGEGQEEEGAGLRGGRAGNGGGSDGRGRGRMGGEFYALRFVRKQWERWLWSALS